MKNIKIYLSEEESEILKRCVVCDSTEHYDTLKSHGIDIPISFWVHVKTENSDEMRCNRCNDAISEAEEFFTQYNVLDKELNQEGFTGGDIISGLDYLENDVFEDIILEDIDIIDDFEPDSR